MSKKIAALMLSVMLLFSAAVMVQAEDSVGSGAEGISQSDSLVQPLFEYTNVTGVSLSISGGKATCVTTINGYYGITTKIVIKMTLQKKTLLWWSKQESWTTTINDWYGGLTKTASVGSGTYRVKVEFTVYSGSKSEDITTHSQEKKC